MTPPAPAELVSFEWGRMPAMADLWVEAWQEAIPEIDFETRRGWLCHRVGELIGEGALFVLAVSAGNPSTLLGFACINPRTGYVDQLVVHPDQWGGGIARDLVEAAASHTRHPLQLDVNEQNGRAVRFYEKAGFVVIAHGVNPTSGRPTLKMERRAAPV
ncbi:GNAT family N-acetyltransferase [Ancylobacter amanitiformis]|uniref:Acetyltransferase n=1 Tax=Ancylobacter amanitiformis TaxID=217069 RepID=A0ABU0LNM6_9HYPH|nr:GNAT family N-acetyltransferase [Ancylobacter amanitiformis]MDQ0510307.1 putative acetyltransferase [Ancylobacter amanitiformis]